MVRWAALTLALAVLAGCGAQPTGHGAPPYQEPPRAKPAALRTTFPAAHLRFTLPAMAGEDEQAVRAYIRFNRAAFATWQSGRSASALRIVATPAMRRLILKLLPVQQRYGSLDLPTLIEIRAVSTQGALSSMTTCIRHAGKASPMGTLLVLRKDGQWQVSASGPLKRRLKHCG